MKKIMDLKLKLAFCTTSLFAVGMESSVFAAHGVGAPTAPHDSMQANIAKSNEPTSDEQFRDSEDFNPKSNLSRDSDFHPTSSVFKPISSSDHYDGWDFNPSSKKTTAVENQSTKQIGLEIKAPSNVTDKISPTMNDHIIHQIKRITSSIQDLFDGHITTHYIDGSKDIESPAEDNKPAKIEHFNAKGELESYTTGKGYNQKQFKMMNGKAIETIVPLKPEVIDPHIKSITNSEGTFDIVDGQKVIRLQKNSAA